MRRAVELLPAWWKPRLRRLNRVRWLTKARVLRESGFRWRDGPLTAARYVFLDPEVQTLTYDLENVDELVGTVADATGQGREVIARYVTELDEDPVFRSDLTAAVRGRWDMKRDPRPGSRAAWYAIVRATKPRLVVETGVLDGLGSLVLLRALEQNADEGSPGRLISFDIDPASGWLVPERLHAHWERIFESTLTALPRALQGEHVAAIVHDSGWNYDRERFELATAVEHASSELTLMSYNDTGALEDVAAQHGVTARAFTEHPRNHFYKGATIWLATLRRS